MDIFDIIAKVLTPIGTLLALIASSILVFRSFKTLPKEIQSVDADLSKKYKDLANESLKDASLARDERNKYRIELEGCCGKIESLEDKVNDLDKIIAKKDDYIVYITNGVKRLCVQMRRKGIPPVFEPLTESEFEENQ
jgi:hypothetical protein